MDHEAGLQVMEKTEPAPSGDRIPIPCNINLVVLSRHYQNYPVWWANGLQLMTLNVRREKGANLNSFIATKFILNFPRSTGFSERCYVPLPHKVHKTN